MKAFLLAAGLGTRLRPLTDRIPKCLVDIAGKPLLGHWFDRLLEGGIDDVILNTHYLADQVDAYIASATPPGLHVRAFHEPELLGSARTVLGNREFWQAEDCFVVAYADNLTDMDLGALIAFHREKESPFTLALFESEEPETCGVATLDSSGRVVAFVEKPAHPVGNLANAGVYVVSPFVFDLLPPGDYRDFGFDVLPHLVGHMYGFPVDGYLCDVGTPERLAAARQEWKDR